MKEKKRAKEATVIKFQLMLPGNKKNVYLFLEKVKEFFKS